MSFHDPWVFVFIPIILISTYLLKKRHRQAGFQFSAIRLISGLPHSFKGSVSSNIIYLRCLALLLMIIALARPQSPIKDTIKRSEGIDIMLTLDVSKSMLAEDFSTEKVRCNRFDAVKKVIPDFINSRVNDKLGMVIFATRPYTVCPLTLNHQWLMSNLERVKAGVLGDRTAIGSAMASSLNRLKKSKAKSKVIILLTDGRNNAGDVSPQTATEIAKALNVKIYTIGAGSGGSVPYPIMDAKGKVTGYETIKVDMDEDLLRYIASQTGGRYFRATDTNSLKTIYNEIDRLEKAPIQEKGYREYNELFINFLLAGIIVLLLEVILSNTILMRLP